MKEFNSLGCLLFIIIFALTAVSCSTMPKKSIVMEGSYSWNNESFELNMKNQSFSASGEVTMWIDNERYRGKFNGDYEILSSSGSKWRIIITGPFNISVATVIINGIAAHVYHDGIWESKPWPEISGGLFNADVDCDMFSVILDGRFSFKGQCAQIENDHKLCKMNGIYYKVVNGKVVEMLSGDLSVVNKEGKWIGLRNGEYAFIFEKATLDNTVTLKESLFHLPKKGKDAFDDI